MMGTVSHPLLSRREAIAALATTAALPLVSACTSRTSAGRARSGRSRGARAARQLRGQPAAPGAGERDLAGPRHRRASGASLAARRSLGGRSAAGGGAAARRPGASQRLQDRRTVARYAHQLRGGAQRLCDVARGIRAPVWRHHGRRLAQHAVRRHSERRRLPGRPAIPRQRPSHRERRRRRGVSGAAAVVREAARRRAWPDGGGARRRAGAAGIPDRQGAGADAPLGEECARRRHARRVPGAADEEHCRHMGRARADHCGAGDCAGARPAAAGTADAARPRHQRRRHLGASARRGVLPVGAQGVDHDEHVAGRGPRDGPERAEASARADGRDPEGDRLLARAPWASG